MAEVPGDSTRSQKSPSTSDSTTEVIGSGRTQTGRATTFAKVSAGSAEAETANTEPSNSLISRTQRSVKVLTSNKQREATASSDASSSSVLSGSFIHRVEVVHFEDKEGSNNHPMLTVCEDSGLHLRQPSSLYAATIHAFILYSTLQDYLPHQVTNVRKLPTSDRILGRMKWKIYGWLEKLGHQLVSRFRGPHQVAGATTNGLGLIDLDFIPTQSDLNLGQPHFPTKRWRMTCMVVDELAYDIMIGDLGLKHLRRLRKGRKTIAQWDHKRFPGHKAVSSSDPGAQERAMQEAQEARKRAQEMRLNSTNDGGTNGNGNNGNGNYDDGTNDDSTANNNNMPGQ